MLFTRVFCLQLLYSQPVSQNVYLKAIWGNCLCGLGQVLCSFKLALCEEEEVNEESVSELKM